MLGDYAMINGQEIGVVLDIVAMLERGARWLDDIRTEQGGARPGGTWLDARCFFCPCWSKG